MTFPRTQKAKGVLHLQRYGLRGATDWAALRPEKVVVVPSSAPQCWWINDNPDEEEPAVVKFPCFARPCPTTPKHGFVESRSVHDSIEAMNVLAETLAADPNGELILMPRCTGKYSAVATNAGIIWGAGNDGVTGGGSAVAGFIPASIPLEGWNEAADALNCDVKECAYVELVEDAGATRLVQLRDGPKQESSATLDYIPRRTEVTQWVGVSDCGLDLIKWDKLIRNASPGTVAVLARSQTRFSHFAVHCLVNKVPLVFGSAPAIGSILEPSEDAKTAPLKQEHYDYLAQVIMDRLLQKPLISGGLACPSPEQIGDQYRITTAVGTCHAMTDWGADEHLLRLRGNAVADCFLFSTAACLGEVRHFYRHGPTRPSQRGTATYPTHTTQLNLLLPPEALEAFLGGEAGCHRSETYANSARLPLLQQIVMARQAAVDLGLPGWESSFGGASWAAAAIQTAWLGRSLLSFCAKPSAARWRRLACRFNATLHACHNNGKVLTKWVKHGVLTAGVKRPTFCFMNPFAAESVVSPPSLLPPGVLKQLFEKELHHEV